MKTNLIICVLATIPYLLLAIWILNIKGISLSDVITYFKHL